jgi:excisionase family DNA binding protein
VYFSSTDYCYCNLTNKESSAMTSNNNKTFLTPGQAAKLLMVSPITVRAWARKGLLLSESTPGGHRRFLLENVERFGKQRKR